MAAPELEPLYAPILSFIVVSELFHRGESQRMGMQNYGVNQQMHQEAQRPQGITSVTDLVEYLIPKAFLYWSIIRCKVMHRLHTHAKITRHDGFPQDLTKDRKCKHESTLNSDHLFV